jgi:hypothetical protein
LHGGSVLEFGSMSWLKKWFGRKTLDDSALEMQQSNHRLMTLDERMAFRREMVYESIREVLAQRGLPPLGYKLNVARLDSRGHRYAVMVDLVLPSAGKVADRFEDWPSLERQAIETASNRYRVVICNVYWRLESPAHGAVGVQDSGVSKYDPATFATTAPAPLPVPKPSFAKRAPVQQDDFPDTQIDDRHLADEPITHDELLAFQQAVLRGQAAQQPVQLGSRTYQTDFMPLG